MFHAAVCVLVVENIGTRHACCLPLFLWWQVPNPLPLAYLASPSFKALLFERQTRDCCVKLLHPVLTNQQQRKQLQAEVLRLRPGLPALLKSHPCTA